MTKKKVAKGFNKTTIEPNIRTVVDLKITRQDLIETVMFDIRNSLDEKIDELHSKIKDAATKNVSGLLKEHDDELVDFGKKFLGKQLMTKLGSRQLVKVIPSTTCCKMVYPNSKPTSYENHPLRQFNKHIDIYSWIFNGLCASFCVRPSGDNRKEAYYISYSLSDEQFHSMKSVKSAQQFVDSIYKCVNELEDALSSKSKIERVAKRAQAALVRAVIRDHAHGKDTLSISAMIDEIKNAVHHKMITTPE